MPTPTRHGGLSPSATCIARYKAAFLSGAWPAVAVLCVASCGPPTVVRPTHVQVVADDYVPVPFLPQPPPVELVPPWPATPEGSPVWADGGWQWNGERFRWDPGAWVVVPAGARRARWVVVRRVIDGQLFFAPSTWRDASGKAFDGPKPLARALTRTGGPAAGGPDE